MGAWELLQDLTVQSNTTSVVLNSFGTITKDDFYKIVFTSITATSQDNQVALYANTATTSTNYHSERLTGGSSVSAERRNDSFFCDTEKNGVAESGIAYLKLSQNDRLNIFVNSNKRISADLINQFSYITSSGATFSSGITSLTFASTGPGSFATGSRFQIYKLAAQKVADITVGSNTTQVDIPNLSIDKDSEYLLVGDLTGAVATQLFINDNTTTTDYYSQRIEGDGSFAGAQLSNQPYYLLTGVGYAHIKLSNIGAYTYQSYGIRSYGTNSLRIENWFGSSTAENITSITKLNIKATVTNAILANSRFQLYKLY